MTPIIECIPNFSEGRDKRIINQIADAIQSTPQVKLLHIDIGYDANRTVMTFAGAPLAVVEAAFQAIKTASQLIDMELHQGEHPRIGATDVCPLVPISGISMNEVVALARQLAAKVSSKLNIPVYCYEAAAFEPHKRNLAACRKGEYEGIAAKIKDPLWQPDYGAAQWNKKSGISVIGARQFLIAYNATLSTEDISIAQAIAQKIRTSGHADSLTKQHVAGKFKALKAIGWHMPEYKAAQVSMNFTDFQISKLHEVIEEIKILASEYSCQFIGSELIGLIPLQAILDAGEYYASLENKRCLPNNELIALACKHLLLDYHESFDAPKRIVEYALEER
ncbi:MAG: glutamate formimidoyltransferase [Mangrovibacterium sp.]